MRKYRFEVVWNFEFVNTIKHFFIYTDSKAFATIAYCEKLHPKEANHMFNMG